MKSLILKEKESKNVLPSVLFEFNPTAKIERKNMPIKRPSSASSKLKTNLFTKDQKNTTSNKVIKVQKQPEKDREKFSTVFKLMPTLKTLKKSTESSNRQQKIKILQDKCITKEKLAKTNKIPSQIEKNLILNFSNFDDDTIIQENQRNSSNELDFYTIFDKFLESDEIKKNTKNQENKAIKEENKVFKGEKTSGSVEIFLKKFEKDCLEKLPIKPTSKKIDPQTQIKNLEFETNNLEGKTAGEVFQHFKKKFNISEMLLQNLKQLKELKKNFQAIKEESKGEKTTNEKQNEPKTKEIKSEDSFEEVKDQTTQEKTKDDAKQYQSSTANVHKKPMFVHRLILIYI